MRDGGAEAHHTRLGDNAGGRLAMAAAGQNRQTGAGDRNQRRAYIVHDIEDWVTGGRQPVEGSRGTEVLLLSGAGFEVFGFFTDRVAL